jgi:AcrR family transcriptional regulator
MPYFVQEAIIQSMAKKLAPGNQELEPAGRSSEERVSLSRERVLRGAMAVADSAGVRALTIRTLAAELGVTPMSVYYYVANKSEILDGIVDEVFSEIDLPPGDGDWRSEIRRRATSARRVLSRHPWAIALLESRKTPGPATLRHHDAMIGTLREAGFSVEMTAHAYALLDSYVYGFAIQEAALPFDGPETVAGVSEPMMEQFPAGEYPHLVEMATEHILQPGYDFGNEFEFGLNVILDALTKSIPERGEEAGSRPERYVRSVRQPRPEGTNEGAATDRR